MDILLFLAFLVCALLIFATIILLGVVFRLDHRTNDMQLSLMKMQELVDTVNEAKTAMDWLESRTQTMHERQNAILENIRFILGEERDTLSDLEHIIEDDQRKEDR